VAAAAALPNKATSAAASPNSLIFIVLSPYGGEEPFPSPRATLTLRADVKVKPLDLEAHLKVFY
jgi:hypothetical protein